MGTWVPFGLTEKTVQSGGGFQLLPSVHLSRGTAVWGWHRVQVQSLSTLYDKNTAVCAIFRACWRFRKIGFSLRHREGERSQNRGCTILHLVDLQA